MDTVFLVDDGSRANYIRLLVQTFGCSYICLWSYLPNYLKFLDGFYNEDYNQPSSSSSTSLVRRLFEGYRSLVFVINNHVPGYAFRNNLPYYQLQERELQTLASHTTQLQFYREARIKTAVFMGCNSGEIELGFSNESQQVSIDIGTMKSWFAEVFTRQLSPEVQPRPNDQNNPPTSSSSSLISLTVDSPEYSSLLFNINPMNTTSATTSNSSQISEITSSHNSMQLPLITPAHLPHQQAMQSFARLRNIQLPSPESEVAAMTRAILAVISSPSSSSSKQQQQYPHHVPPIDQNLPSISHFMNPKASVFKKYAPHKNQVNVQPGRQSMLKRSFSFFTNLSNFMRSRQRMQETSRPSTTQLHHMIAERKRREKLNESFHALRSLLPPGTKKDKASVLTATREYLTTLQSQISELTKRIKQLEEQALASSTQEEKEAGEEAQDKGCGCSSSSINERVSVRMSQVSESTSEEGRVVDLRLSLRTTHSAEDVLIRILQFLNQVQGLSLLSLQSNSHITTTQSSSTIRITLRLRVDQGNDWDESGFQEAVRRVVEDLSR